MLLMWTQEVILLMCIDRIWKSQESILLIQRSQEAILLIKDTGDDTPDLWRTQKGISFLNTSYWYIGSIVLTVHEECETFDKWC